MEKEIDARTVKLLLGAFELSIPVKEAIYPKDIILIRNIVAHTFALAQYEYLEKKTLFGRQIHPHPLIVNIRPGSIELDVLYQIVANIPYSEIAEKSNLLIQQGMEFLKEIGSIAAGIIVLKDIGKWIWKNLREKQVPLRSIDDQHIPINVKSMIEIKDSLPDKKDELIDIRNKLYHEINPISLATLVKDKNAINYIFDTAKMDKNEDVKKIPLGGRIIINDLNLYINGIRSLEELNVGDLLLINNYSALGLHYNNDPSSVYNSASADNPDIEVLSVIMSSHKTKEEKPILRGRLIDSDDLENA